MTTTNCGRSWRRPISDMCRGQGEGRDRILRHISVTRTKEGPGSSRRCTRHDVTNGQRRHPGQPGRPDEGDRPLQRRSHPGTPPAQRRSLRRPRHRRQGRLRSSRRHRRTCPLRRDPALCRLLPGGERRGGDRGRDHHVALSAVARFLQGHPRPACPRHRGAQHRRPGLSRPGHQRPAGHRDPRDRRRTAPHLVQVSHGDEGPRGRLRDSGSGRRADLRGHAAGGLPPRSHGADPRREHRRDPPQPRTGHRRRPRRHRHRHLEQPPPPLHRGGGDHPLLHLRRERRSAAVCDPHQRGPRARTHPRRPRTATRLSTWRPAPST